MGCHTQDHFKEWFVENPIGFDLGNVEVKYSNKTIPEWVVQKNDINADFLMLFSEQDFVWYFINCKELPKVRYRKNPSTEPSKYHRTIKLSFAKKWSYLKTDDSMKAMNELEEIVSKPKKHLRWLINE